MGQEAERYHGVTYKFSESGKGIAVFWHKDEEYPEYVDFDVHELIKQMIDEHIKDHAIAKAKDRGLLK